MHVRDNHRMMLFTKYYAYTFFFSTLQTTTIPEITHCVTEKPVPYSIENTQTICQIGAAAVVAEIMW